jgi:hypothetical protein
MTALEKSGHWLALALTKRLEPSVVLVLKWSVAQADGLHAGSPPFPPRD